MKQFILLMFLCFCSIAISAQDEPLSSTTDDDIETIFSDDVEVTGFGGPVLKFATINDGTQFLLGGRGGTLFDSKFFWGWEGFVMLTSSEVKGYKFENPLNNQKKVYLRYLMVGTYLEYIIFPNKLLHFAINTSISFGLAGLTGSVNSDENYLDDDTKDWLYESSGFLVLSPGATAEVNVSRYFRIGIGGGYRFVFGENLPNLTNKNLSGPTLDIVFKFGVF